MTGQGEDQQSQRQCERRDRCAVGVVGETVAQLQQVGAVHLYGGMGIRDPAAGHGHSLCHRSLHRTHRAQLVGRRSPVAAASTPSVVITPRGPGGTPPRSTPSSAASLRAPGLALGRGARAGSAAGVDGVVGAVADQHRRAHRRSRFNGLGRRLSRRTGVDSHQRRPDREHVTLGTAEFDDPAGVRAGNLHFGFGRLHRAQRLVEFHLVADGHLPAGHRELFESLTQVWNRERLDLCCAHGHHSSPRKREVPHIALVLCIVVASAHGAFQDALHAVQQPVGS